MGGRDIDKVKLALSEGATAAQIDTNNDDVEDESILHTAVRNHDIAMVKLLVTHGAPVTWENEEGLTPKDLLRGNEELAAELLKALYVSERVFLLFSEFCHYAYYEHAKEDEHTLQVFIEQCMTEANNPKNQSLSLDELLFTSWWPVVARINIPMPSRLLNHIHSHLETSNESLKLIIAPFLESRTDEAANKNYDLRLKHNDDLISQSRVICILAHQGRPVTKDAVDLLHNVDIFRRMSSEPISTRPLLMFIMLAGKYEDAEQAIVWEPKDHEDACLETARDLAKTKIQETDKLDDHFSDIFASCVGAYELNFFKFKHSKNDRDAKQSRILHMLGMLAASSVLRQQQAFHELKQILAEIKDDIAAYDDSAISLTGVVPKITKDVINDALGGEGGLQEVHANLKKMFKNATEAIFKAEILCSKDEAKEKGRQNLAKIEDWAPKKTYVDSKQITVVRNMNDPINIMSRRMVSTFWTSIAKYQPRRELLNDAEKRMIQSLSDDDENVTLASLMTGLQHKMTEVFILCLFLMIPLLICSHRRCCSANFAPRMPLRMWRQCFVTILFVG